MRYLIIVAMLFTCGVAFADATGGPDGGGIWAIPALNHSHSYDKTPDKYSEYQKKQGMGLGVGVDTILYEFDGPLNNWGLDSVNTEYKWDMNNNNQSLYFVTHVNAWKVIKQYLK